MNREKSKTESKESYWKEQIKKWELSNLCQSKYCKQAGISYTTFCYWRSVISKKKIKSDTPQLPSQASFKQAIIKPYLENKPSLDAKVIKVTLLNQTIVEIPLNISVIEMRSIFHALGDIA